MTTPTLSIPAPEQIIPGFAVLPEAIQAAIEELSKPFPIDEVKVRPGSVRRDGSAALCLAYGDWWTCYLPRLNDTLGPNNWTIDLQPWGEHQIIARLRAFGGLIEKASSGSAKGEANGAQEAEAQAKKRVVAEGLMLGLYFYFLPRVWGKGERAGKDFVFADGEEQRCVFEMYRRASLDVVRHSGSALPRDTRPERPTPSAPRPVAPSDSTTPAPLSERALAARAALARTERRAGMTTPNSPAPTGRDDRARPTAESTADRATDPQLGLIARLITILRRQGDTDAQAETAHAIDAIGASFGIAGDRYATGRSASGRPSGC